MAETTKVALLFERVESEAGATVDTKIVNEDARGRGEARPIARMFVGMVDMSGNTRKAGLWDDYRDPVSGERYVDKETGKTYDALYVEIPNSEIRE